MSRRLLILLLPALALVVWLVAAQLPRWTAPAPGWFARGTPGVCAAVRSLALYDARRVDPADGLGREAAQADAERVAADHYDAAPLDVSEPLAVEASLPGAPRSVYSVVTVRLSDAAPEKAAVIYLDAATGEPRALITATDDPAAICDFDVRAALLAAVKSPPLILLVAYVVLVAGVALVRRIARGKPR